MKTNIYNVWSELVQEFISAICVDKELHQQVDVWLDNEGSKTFEMGQGMYFRQNLADYSQASLPYSEKLFELSKNQISAGFQAWFDALLNQFPTLDNPAVKEKHTLFAASCVDEKFHPFIAARMTITWQLVKRGDLKDINFAMKSFELLENAAHHSLLSINEYLKKRNETPSVPRESASPAFYKQVSAPEEWGPKESSFRPQ